jgi:hypothetical protein
MEKALVNHESIAREKLSLYVNLEHTPHGSMDVVIENYKKLVT